jgi:hypothetical protein
VLGDASRLIAEGGWSNDACLTARRLVESAWDLRRPEPEYQRAADLLDQTGHGRLAEIFYGIAGTGAELTAAQQAWQARMALAPVSAQVLAEQLAEQLAAGLVGLTGVPELGVDGAWYQPAVHRGRPGEPGLPAVLVSTMTTRELVTGFGSQAAQEQWLRTRGRAAGRGPITDPGVDPAPRVVMEERVLAWLIRHPDWLRDIGRQDRAGLWTAECRHEIDAALYATGVRDGRDGYPSTVRELRRRTLRAPLWAGDLIGWPDGRWVQQYLWRLAATNVTETSARDAFQSLATNPVAGQAVAGSVTAGLFRIWPERGHAARLAGPRDQRAAEMDINCHPRPDSIGARTRLTQSRPGPTP